MKHLKYNNEGIRYTDGVVSLGDSNNPLAKLWTSLNLAPEYVSRTDSRFMSGRVYNYVYNDIAECMPSDGSLNPCEIAMLDMSCDHFRLTKFDFTLEHSDLIIGIVSKEPGYIVGYNEAYENPIYIALKGMVWIKYHEGFIPEKGKEIGIVEGLIDYKTNISTAYFLLKYVRLGTIIEINESLNMVKLFV
jgi:hypothetical protein